MESPASLLQGSSRYSYCTCPISTFRKGEIGRPLVVRFSEGYSEGDTEAQCERRCVTRTRC